MYDFQESFDHVSDATAHFGKVEFNSYVDHWGHIVDSETWKVVATLKQESGPQLNGRGPVKIKSVDVPISEFGAWRDGL